MTIDDRCSAPTDQRDRARKAVITADTALRLTKAFGNSAQFWLNIQDRCELDLVADKLGDLAKITRLSA
jgi:plasmid maintenance system antidote protein VapI